MYIILMYIIYSFHTLSSCSRRPLNFTTLPLYHFTTLPHIISSGNRPALPPCHTHRPDGSLGLTQWLLRAEGMVVSRAGDEEM